METNDKTSLLRNDYIKANTAALRAEYMRSQKCFDCGETGHQVGSKDCKAHKARKKLDNKAGRIVNDAGKVTGIKGEGVAAVETSSSSSNKALGKVNTKVAAMGKQLDETVAAANKFQAKYDEQQARLLKNLSSIADKVGASLDSNENDK